MRVLVTRAAEDAQPLIEALESAGLEVLLVPLVERRRFPRQVAAVADRGHDGWVITSAAAVDALAQVRRTPSWIAAVGPATARALEAAGHRVDVVPETATAADLAAALGDRSGQRVLYPRAAQPSPGTLEGLRATGAVIDDVVAYDNVEPAGAADALQACWPVDLVTAMSGSVIRRLAGHLPAPWPPGVRLVVIGPRTEEVAVQAGLTVHAVAEPHTAEGLVAAVTRISAAGPAWPDPW